jgi:regulator of replication initiation timing
MRLWSWIGNKFFLSLTFLFLLLLVHGCGIPKEAYVDIVAERDALQMELDSLRNEMAEIKEAYVDIVAEGYALQAELESIKSQPESMRIDKEAYDAIVTERDALQMELDSLRNEMAEIKEVYPPRDFSSASELRDWLFSNTVSERTTSKTFQDWFAKALEIQEDALEDGYIISADIDYNEKTGEFSVICVAIIDGEYWAWNPENDEPIHDPRLGKVK